VVGFTTGFENVGHKLYMDNFSSSLNLFNDLHIKKIYCCGTVRKSRRGMPQEFRTMKLTRGDIRTRVRGNMTTMFWKDKRHVNILMNMHHRAAEGNFRDEHGNALKSMIIQDYNRCGLFGQE
jgi:hypothetical protein